MSTLDLDLQANYAWITNCVRCKEALTGQDYFEDGKTRMRVQHYTELSGDVPTSVVGPLCQECFRIEAGLMPDPRRQAKIDVQIVLGMEKVALDLYGTRPGHMEFRRALFNLGLSCQQAAQVHHFGERSAEIYRRTFWDVVERETNR